MSQSINKPVFIFDFGGVLLDWDPRYLYRSCFNGDEAAMERFLAETDFYTWNLRQDEGRPFAEAIAEICARYPEYCDLIRAYDTRWSESISGPNWGSVNILYSLKQAGYSLYGLSNWSAEKFPLMKHKHEFFSWFQDIILSGDVKIIKPDPRIFQVTLQRIGRPAEDCLLIDDSEKNIAMARQLGLQAIHFQSPEQLAQTLAVMGIETSGDPYHP
jgi:2-haloacid dehalogenase